MPAPCVLLRNFVSVLFARARSAKARAVLFQSSEQRACFDWFLRGPRCVLEHSVKSNQGRTCRLHLPDEHSSHPRINLSAGCMAPPNYTRGGHRLWERSLNTAQVATERK